MSYKTAILVDGENIDRTLGQFWGRKPRSNERPRWENVRTFLENQWGAARALFFIHQRMGSNPAFGFYQALSVAGYRPILLTEESEDEKVVDAGIIKTMEWIAAQPEGERIERVILISNDGDFLPAARALDGVGVEVGVVGFREVMSPGYEQGFKIWDLEYDVRGAFDCGRLPRLSDPVTVAAFDPAEYLAL